MGSTPEVAGDAALLINPYDARDIADAIRAVDSDADLRGRLSEMGKVSRRRSIAPRSIAAASRNSTSDSERTFPDRRRPRRQAVRTTMRPRPEMAILVTGAAGFIGYHVADRLLARGETVFGIDNLNDYYSVALKRDRITDIATRRGDSFRFLPLDFSDHEALDRGLDGHGIDRIVHLGGAGRGALLHREPARLRSGQRGRSPQHPGICAPPGCGASRLCIVLLGLWRQYLPALPGRGPCPTIRSRSMPPQRKRTS